MTKRIPEPRPELAPGIREHEARLLALMLRTSRLTWLFADRGTDKTGLLMGGVMPLLQRRRSDRPRARQPEGSAPVSGVERRSTQPKPGARRAEVAIYFDRWTEDCLAELKTRLVETLLLRGGESARVLRLAEALGAMQDQLNVHVVLVLDRFEELLALPQREPGVASFAEEFVEALLTPCLSANFLVAMNEEALPRLHHLRERMPDLDQNSLRLSPISRAGGAPSLSSARTAFEAQDDPQTYPPASNGSPTTVAAAKEDGNTSRRGAPRQSPITLDQVYAFIEAKLATTSLTSPTVKEAKTSPRLSRDRSGEA